MPIQTRWGELSDEYVSARAIAGLDCSPEALDEAAFKHAQDARRAEIDAVVHAERQAAVDEMNKRRGDEIDQLCATAGITREAFDRRTEERERAEEKNRKFKDYRQAVFVGIDTTY